MDESILGTIKKLLGLSSDYTAFDTDIIVFINSVFMTLEQIGIGPEGGFSITGEIEEWSDFIPEVVIDQQAIPTYVYLKVKLLFDPPASSFGQEALKKQAEEMEWRLNVQSPEFEEESGIV